MSCDVSLLTDLLCESKPQLLSQKTDLVYLEAVANVRYAFQYICNWLVSNQNAENELHIDLLKAVKNLCVDKSLNSLSTGPQIFLLKSLYRRCGEIGFKTITSNQSLEWIWPENMCNDQAEVRFIGIN